MTEFGCFSHWLTVVLAHQEKLYKQNQFLQVKFPCLLFAPSTVGLNSTSVPPGGELSVGERSDNPNVLSICTGSSRTSFATNVPDLNDSA